jgi:GTP-binding protein EngB required for normal cell division
MLATALELLYRLSAGRGGAGVVQPDALRPLRRALAEEGWHRADLPRVVLVGEFKAGKSTLLNALFGRRVAASDVLEMTSWVARYWPAIADRCTLLHADGTESERDLEEFLADCEARRLDGATLASIDRVDVAVRGTALGCAIVDCPGLGSTTRENERRLLDAVQEADAVLWVVDVDAVGSLRDASLVQTLRQLGLPMLVTLAKCDLLDDPSELDELVAWLARSLSMDAGAVFPTAALPALNASLRGAPAPADTGVPNLITHLREQVAPRRSALRAKAQAAHHRAAAQHADRLLAEAERQVTDAESAVRDFGAITNRVRDLVGVQVEAEVLDAVRERLFEGQQEALAGDLAAALRRGALSDQTMTDIFRQRLGDGYLDDLWTRLAGLFGGRIAEVWAAQHAGVRAELEVLCQRFDAEAGLALRTGVQANGVETRIAAASSAAMETGVRASLGLAGAATAYAAWLGPAAAQVTLGAAATGVGIPIALVGVGVSAALAWRQRRDAEMQVAAQVAGILDAWRTQFVDGVVRGQLLPRLALVNEAVARQLLADFERQAGSGFPEGDLAAFRAEITKVRRGLESAMSSGALPGRG